MSKRKKEFTSRNGGEETFYIVTLKHRNTNYYLVDFKLSISLNKSNAMLFIDEEVATDYASKLEYAYVKFMGDNALGYVENYKHLFSIQ